MATGHYDAQGIWQYGEDDTDANASDMLNRLAESVSDALAQLSTVQSGSVTPSPASIPANSTAEVTITFAAPFAAAPEMIAPSWASVVNSVIPYYAAVTATGAKLMLRNVSGGAVSPGACRWGARGKLA